MYVVVFRAQINQLDPQYDEMAARLRDMALTEFGCTEFFAVADHQKEIALSYWPDTDAITRWRQAALHLEAQSAGRERWYSAYQVDIARIERSYSQPFSPPQ